MFERLSALLSDKEKILSSLSACAGLFDRTFQTRAVEKVLEVCSSVENEIISNACRFTL